MALETLASPEDIELTQRALAYYRDTFAGDPDAEGAVLWLNEGDDGGYVGYWAVEVDAAGRCWLGPLHKLSPTPSGDSVYIRPQNGGFTADFSPRVVGGRDRFYDYVVRTENVDSIMAGGRFYGIPISEVIGEPEQLPGFYCDENGQPPDPGPSGENYMAADQTEYWEIERAYLRARTLPPVELAELYGIKPEDRPPA